MHGREDHIYSEAVALWRTLYDEPPPATIDGAALLRLITARLPFHAYDRMTSAHLRPGSITGPRTSSASG